MEEERLFFAGHQAYKSLSKELLGTQSLTKKLTNVMYEHIKTVLPAMIKEINNKIKSCEENIRLLGEPIPMDNKLKLEQIWYDVSIFIDKFKSNVKGEFSENYKLGEP